MSNILTQTRKIGITAIALASLSLSAVVIAAEGSAEEAATEVMQPKRAVIHFADLGGIENWRAVDERTLEIEGRNGDWYRAELWTNCIGLRSANEIAFISEPNGDLDRFSSIYVGRGERCQFRTFNKIEMPEPE